MRVVRKTPTAINKPYLIVGIERLLLIIILGLSIIIGIKTRTVIGLGVFFGACTAGRYAARKDPDLLPIMRESMKLKPIYDPIKREVK